MRRLRRMLSVGAAVAAARGRLSCCRPRDTGEPRITQSAVFVYGETQWTTKPESSIDRVIDGSGHRVDLTTSGRRRPVGLLACTAPGTRAAVRDKMTARRTNDARRAGAATSSPGEFPNWAFDDDERRRSWRRLIRGYRGVSASLERGEASTARASTAAYTCLLYTSPSPRD